MSNASRGSASPSQLENAKYYFKTLPARGRASFYTLHEGGSTPAMARVELKSEKREKGRLKKKRAPKGGTLAGQKKKMEASKFYKGKVNR